MVSTSMDAAREFVAAVRERFGLDGQTFSSAEAAHQHDRFPFRQVPPVLSELGHSRREIRTVACWQRYGYAAAIVFIGK